MSIDFEGIKETAGTPVGLAYEFSRDPHAQSQASAPVAHLVVGGAVIGGNRPPIVDTFTRSSDQTVDPAGSTSNTGEHDPHKRGTSNYGQKGPKTDDEDHLGLRLDEVA